MSDDSNIPAGKRSRAVALHYAKEDRAPKIVATGAGEIAKRILALAEEHNVPVRKDDSLVNILSKLDIGYEIPADTYRVVAEILAFLYRTDEEWRDRKDQEGGLLRDGRVDSSQQALGAGDAEPK